MFLFILNRVMENNKNSYIIPVGVSELIPKQVSGGEMITYGQGIWKRNVRIKACGGYICL